MSNAVKLAVVVPTLNEAENIETVLQRVTDTMSRLDCRWEVIVVDDCSQDGTGNIVEEFAQRNACVRLVVRQHERGLAGAITHGWASTNADLLGVIDADMQHPPEVILVLLEKMLKGADLAIASRYIRPGSMDGWNPLRRFVSRVSVIASIPVQKREIRVRDPLSGFFMVRRRCIEGVQFQKTGFKLLLEILAKGKIRSVVEVPFRFGFRGAGTSKANILTGIHYLSLLLRLSLLRSSRPERLN